MISNALPYPFATECLLTHLEKRELKKEWLAHTLGIKNYELLSLRVCVVMKYKHVMWN